MYLYIIKAGERSWCININLHVYGSKIMGIHHHFLCDTDKNIYFFIFFDNSIVVSGFVDCF